MDVPIVFIGPPWPPPLPVELITAICTKQANRFNAHDVDDLVQHCATACLRESGKFDASKSAWPTWCVNVSKRRLIDLLRHDSRRIATSPLLAGVDAAASSTEAPENVIDLAEWLWEQARPAARTDDLKFAILRVCRERQKLSLLAFSRLSVLSICARLGWERPSYFNLWARFCHTQRRQSGHKRYTIRRRKRVHRWRLAMGKVVNGVSVIELPMTTDQAAVQLGRSPHTLEQWRRRGKGPKVTRIGGRVGYLKRSLVEYIEAGTGMPGKVGQTA